MLRAPKFPIVLVVDDSPEDLLLFKEVLGKAHLKNPVVTAESGAKAIAYLRKSCQAGGSPRGCEPAVIFLDVKMPLRDGFEVLRWIRGKKAFLKSKVIMLTGSDNPKDLQRASESGADGFLLKHPAPDTVAFMIRDATAGCRPRPRR